MSDAEYWFVVESAGVLDVSARSRLCVTGADRARFLHGQVTNDVQRLKVGQGCYAALVNAKGKMQSDLFVYQLPEELLLDFEPGLSGIVAARLEKYIIADDAEVIDVAPHYAMLTVQGPRSGEVVRAVGLSAPNAGLHWESTKVSAGEIYCMNNARGAASGFDIFLPNAERDSVLSRFGEAAKANGGGYTSVEALEIVRVEAGIPRFGVDMDDTNLAPETGIEGRAISYTKGCYIGQEVISRIRTYGQVAKRLWGLRWYGDLRELPARGEKLWRDGKEAGYVTSAVRSPRFKCVLGLGYVRREHGTPGTELKLAGADGAVAVMSELPFREERSN